MARRKRKLNDSKKLASIYYNIKHPGGFSHAKILQKYSGIPHKKVQDFLQAQDTYTIHKRHVKIKSFNSYRYSGVFDTWQCDLCDLSALKSSNDSYKYILGCIDTVSKFAWLRPLKNKSGPTVTKAMESILHEAKHRIPNKLYVDQGTEFNNRDFKSLMEKWNIHMYTTTTVLRHCNII